MTDKMSDYYWNEYAKGKKTGVCIKIDNKNFWYRNIKDDRGSYLKHKNDKIIDLDWIIYSLDGLMIIYDNVEKYSIEDEKFKNFFSECKNLCEEKKRDLYRVKHCQGYLKSSDWGVKEKEYRIRAVIKNKCKFEINGEYKNPPYEYIFIDFSNFIDNISVGFCR